MQICETKRLILRTWRDDDFQPMCDINQDPLVMAHFPALQDAQTTQRLIDNARRHFDQHGYGLYAVERRDTGEFIGFIGCQVVGFEASFAPATEIAWRLASAYWGNGFATEGARAVLRDAFQRLALPEVVSFTAATNTRSIRVMQKIGLIHDMTGDFEHPRLEPNSPLCRHVLYRLRREQWPESIL